MVSLHSSMPPTQFMGYFSHVLFILRYRCIFCFDTHITYMACQKKYLKKFEGKNKDVKVEIVQ